MSENISYLYSKARKDFGRQPRFCEVAPNLLDSINPDRKQQREYCLRNPVHHYAQATEPQIEHDVNTKVLELQEQGVNHEEGGWPKEVNLADEEVTTRYRRRYERDDAYVDAVLGLYPNFIHYVDQNNGIEIYEKFFKEITPLKPYETPSIHVNNVFKDPDNRSIACLGWTQESNSKIVTAYCNKKFPITKPVNTNILCYVWNIENPYSPSDEFQPPTACWQIACSPVHPAIIMGGLDDGRVCIFDIRAKKEPTNLSSFYTAHRDPVSALLYIPSRHNNEFFTGSTDGACKWWDERMLTIPTDVMIMSIRLSEGEEASLANSEGVSALQYDRSFPTKFMCGTDTGFAISINRKGKSFKEKFHGVFQAHKGPVKAVHRSPCTSKMFITCGDWTVHIWSEDIHSSPIIPGMTNRHQILDVIWAPHKFSCYMTANVDGKFRYWDMLRRYHEPIVTLPVSKYPLQKIQAHGDGKLIAIGDSRGGLFVLSLSDSLVEASDRDKQLMTQIYDRESRREHILENRVKEIRLKLKAEEGAVAASQLDIVDEEASIQAADGEYKRIVAEELRLAGNAPPSKYMGIRDDAMRKR
ncbi:dynein intermediate chain 3, ciliary [Manduca sexta]|uniref:dynein intermediate chain 3, ciliary n=1 Tax=Manduca sexta TaxID=7130 RepID=UPI00188FCFE3|nr:dynein intermediate chain 3, ciliary [Manduca sexta]